VLISTVNWNEHSPTKNREVGVIIHGDVADYYVDVFMYDWEGGEKHDFVLLLIIIGFLIISIMFMTRKRKGIPVAS
jgi:phosphatidylserine/phosphatidylglycerophosphate/cardiolipin synthase-like enzyme